MGACAYDLILDYYDYLEPGAIVEVGSVRGEGSTPFFLGLTFNSDKFKFYTVDPNHWLINGLKRFEKYPNFKAVNDFGEKYLNEDFENENIKISFAYLDGFDIIRENQEDEPFIKEQIRQYKEWWGVDMTNENSHQSHLLAAQGVVKNSSDKCLILIDDTWLNTKGEYEGKGKLCVPYLLDLGWKMLPHINLPYYSNQYAAFLKQ